MRILFISSNYTRYMKNKLLQQGKYRKKLNLHVFIKEILIYHASIFPIYNFERNITTKFYIFVTGYCVFAPTLRSIRQLISISSSIFHESVINPSLIIHELLMKPQHILMSSKGTIGLRYEYSVNVQKSYKKSRCKTDEPRSTNASNL
jgi:hypothetical protein